MRLLLGTGAFLPVTPLPDHHQGVAVVVSYDFPGDRILPGVQTFAEDSANLSVHKGSKAAEHIIGLGVVLQNIADYGFILIRKVIHSVEEYIQALIRLHLFIFVQLDLLGKPMPAII